MKPLFILIGAFIISLLATKLFTGESDYFLSGRIAMSSMLFFTASGHFAFTKGMTLMIPDPIPFKKELVYFTGLIEIGAAAGLLIPSFQDLTAWLLILFFILIIPVNINAARRKIDYQKSTANGKGIKYLWFRVPLQLFFIAWVYFFTLKK
jgi:uncharacterized membrane protein